MSCGCGGSCCTEGRPRLIRARTYASSSTLAGPSSCSGKYSYLVQAADGRSKSWPYGKPGIWCNEVDAEAWYAQVKYVRGLCKAAVQQVHPDQRPVDLMNLYDDQWETMDDPDWYMAFGLGGCSEAVSSMIANLETGACLLEVLEGVGSTLPIPSTPPPSDPTSTLTDTSLLFGGLALLGLLIWKSD